MFQLQHLNVDILLHNHNVFKWLSFDVWYHCILSRVTNWKQ